MSLLLAVVCGTLLHLYNGSGPLPGTDTRQNRHIVRTAVASEHHKKQAYVTPAASVRTIASSLLTMGLR